MSDDMDNYAHTAAERAEMAGAMEARSTLEAMAAAPNQATRLTLFHDALCALSESQETRRAALGGFAVITVAWLDQAMGK